MDPMYQVCELEESHNIKLTHYERFSVVAVPETWIILLADGTLLCFWPSANVERKIRSMHYPGAGEKCMYYKCRILLDGAKFSTYEEADRAVQVAQNVSSIMDSSVSMENQEIENPCNSTMNFDVVEFADEEENNDGIVECNDSGFDVSEDDTQGKIETPDPNSSGFDVSEADDENGKITGHDSFEFNKVMLKRGHYHSKKENAMTFRVQNIGKFSSTVVGAPKSSEDLDYNSKFKLNDANFSTSTIIDDVDSQQKPEKLIGKIFVMEMKIFTLVESVKNDVEDLKHAVSKLNQPEAKDVQENAASNVVIRTKVDKQRELLSDGGESILERETDEIFSLNSQSVIEIPENTLNYTFVLQPQSAKDALEEEIQKNLIRETSSSVEPNNISNETVQLSKTGGSTSIKSHDISLAPIETDDVLPESNDDVRVPVDPQDEADPLDEDATSNGGRLIFPYAEVKDHIRNEDLLGDTDFDSALIQFLEPYTDEDEATYMERAVGKVFTDDFFLKCVSWKKEKDRMNMKHSKLLSCWKASIGKRFQTNVSDEVIQSHFRRLKSKKRAQIKAKLNVKAKAKGICKKK